MKALMGYTVYRDAIRTYGQPAQEWMIIEELSELQKEICKHQRGANNSDKIAEEIADVCIMLEQAKLMYGISDEQIDANIAYKTTRLQRRLEDMHGHSDHNQ